MCCDGREMTDTDPSCDESRPRKKTPINKSLSTALLVGDASWRVFGINATNSFSSEVSTSFAGSPSDNVI